MKKPLTIIALALVFVYYTTTFAKAQAPLLSSKAAVLASADSGQILYDFNGDERFSPAFINALAFS